MVFNKKALFAIKIFKFLLLLFGQVINGLIRKIRLISKFMTSQTGKQTIAIRILYNTKYLKRQRQSGSEIWSVNRI